MRPKVRPHSQLTARHRRRGNNPLPPPLRQAAPMRVGSVQQHACWASPDLQVHPSQQKPSSRKAFHYAAYAFWPLLVLWVLYSYPSGASQAAATRHPKGATAAEGCHIACIV